MKASVEYLNFIMDKLSPIGDIRSRAMFGGYGIFHQAAMFALIAGDTLYFKVDESNRSTYEKAQSRPFPHGISYWEVPAEVLEDDSNLLDWANASIAIARSVARKRSKSH
jgi:DNA transformation protein